VGAVSGSPGPDTAPPPRLPGAARRRPGADWSGADWSRAGWAGEDDAMLGALILAAVIVVAIPVGLSLSGAVVSAVLGWSLKGDVDARHEGSELVELNK
jgi:hypothetical protein